MFKDIFLSKGNMDREKVNLEKLEKIKLSQLKIELNDAQESIDMLTNRTQETLRRLYHFDDLVLHLDEKNGPHLLVRKGRSDNSNKEVVSIPHLQSLDSERLKVLQDYIYTFISTIVGNFSGPIIVQNLGILELILRNDALIQYKSGSGKTLAYIVGTLWNLDPQENVPQILYITNTHDTARQIFDNYLDRYLPKDKRIKYELCIGEKKIPGGFRKPKHKIKMIDTRAHIYVCTVGKLYNLAVQQRKIDLGNIRTICIDEFDAIITNNYGHRRNNYEESNSGDTSQQIQDILNLVPKDAQRIFISATLENYVETLSKVVGDYFRPTNNDPFIMLLPHNDTMLPNISQYYMIVPNEDTKYKYLMTILKKCTISQAIIFVNMIKKVHEVASYIKEIVTPVLEIHGELEESKRKEIFQKYKEGTARYLVSTDIFSRGVDSPSTNIVINFDMPEKIETYIHRIGRSGRNTTVGKVISFVIKNNKFDEMQKIKEINRCSRYSCEEITVDTLSKINNNEF